MLRDEKGLIELYENINNAEKIKEIGKKFNENNGMDKLYVNICILREAVKTMTENLDLRKSIFKTILQVWKDIGIWIND